MNRLQPTTVDVRDMLCAQALAVVAQAMERTEGALEILWNTDDVHRDLLAWVRDRGFRYDDQSAATTLRIERVR
jgi:hypothetical protein